MPRHTFSFPFEELALVIEGGFEAGLVNGSAEIAYYPDGDWFIDSISLDGHKRLHHTIEAHWAASIVGKPLPVFERKPIALDEGSSLYLMIYERLENEWRDAVHDAVQEQIEKDGPQAAWLADHRRDSLKHEVVA